MAPAPILHPRTGLEALGFTKYGMPIWPVMGAEDNPPPAGPPPPPGDPKGDDKGFPGDKSVVEMTDSQQAAYWKHQARRHESRVKEIGLTPDEVKALRDKATRHDALERELMSDKDKAVAEAADKAKADAEATYRPQMVRFAFQAAAAGKIDADRLTTILEPLDMSKFLTGGGDVDTKKVADYVAALPTDKGGTPRGPTTFGLGTQPPTQAKPGEQGRAMAARRFGEKAKS